MPDGTLLVGPLDRVLFFRTLPAMDGLPVKYLAAMAASAREVYHPRGSVILAPGELPGALHVVVDGQVRSPSASSPEGETGPGESVGLLHLLARVAPEAPTIAATDTLLLRLDWEDHLDVCEMHFPIVEHYLRHLARRTMRLVQVAPGRMVGGEQPPNAPIPEARRLDLVERLLWLRASEFFPRSAPDALAELARHVEEIRLHTGEAAWREGEAAEFGALVVRGSLAYRDSVGDTLITLGPTQGAGMQEALAGAPRWCSAVAGGEPTVVLKVGVQAILDIMEDHFDMAIDFLALRAAEVLHWDRTPPAESRTAERGE